MNNIDLINCIDETCLIENFKVNSAEECNNLLGNPTDQITILAQNIRSIRKNLDQFLVFLARLSFRPDVIIFSEARIDDSFTNIYLPNYNCHSSTILRNQNDGLVIYTRQGINFEVKEPHFDDANCLTIKLRNELTIVAIYRSPSIDKIDAFINSLERTIISVTTKSCIITGDINIDIKPNSVDRKRHSYLELTGHYGFIPGHVTVTREASRTCLDHALIRTKTSSRVIVCDTDCTDHFGILTSINANKSITYPRSKIVPHIDYNEISVTLLNVNWENFFKETDVNCATEFLTKQIISATKKHTTWKKIRSADVILKPWMSKALIARARRKDKLHSEARKAPNNPILQNNFRDYRNKFNLLLETTKNKYDAEQINTNKNNSKKLWNIIKDICNIKSPKSNSTDILKAKPTEIDSLNSANNFFTSIGSDLAQSILQKLQKSEQHLADKIKPRNTQSLSFFITPTDPFEIQKIISNLKSNSAPGSDQISNKLLKSANLILAPLISHICNLSFSQGIVPNSLKTADVTPIHKSGPTTSISNYRPISLLPSMSKILEKVVNKRLLSFLETNNILSPNQFGFRRSKSTEDAVLALVDKITSKLDSSKKILGVFLDLAKAFDTVSWPILLQKLEHLGVRGLALDWFRSYLSERRQRVRISDQFSDYSPVSFGVPQGSVLGPTLFLTYINDLCQLEIQSASIYSFADDTALLFYSDSWQRVVDVAQRGLSQVTSWLDDNLLTLNTSKTKYLTFHSTQRSQPKALKLKLHSCGLTSQPCSCPILGRANEIKYLGVVIDSNLTFEKHTQVLRGRLRQMLHIFKRLGTVADPKTLRTAYISLGQSVLTYCIACWGSVAKTRLKKVEIAQRAILKVAYKKSMRYPTDKLYKETNYLTVRQLYIMAITLRFHKTALITTSSTKQTSRRNAWPIPKTRTSLAQRSYAFKSPQLYKKLDTTLSLLESTRFVCKKKLTSWLTTLNYRETESLIKT